MSYQIKSKCENCPFHVTGPGRELRRGLRPGRWREILRGLRDGGHFICHKTAEYHPDDDGETGELPLVGSPKLCAGAVEWQQKRNLKSYILSLIATVEGKAKS